MDLIDQLVGIAPGSALDAVRAQRAVAREHSQKSHEALFAPADPGTFTPAERHAVAAYVAALHGEGPVAAHHAAELARHDAALAQAVAAAAAATRTTGPYGRYPLGPLSREDAPGPDPILPPEVAAALGPRLAAALLHAHFLVFHPRDAAADRFAPLLAAGWTTDELVTLSQIVAFLTYQIRVVAGLRVLAAAG
ncbi:MAG: CMD domain protein [Rubritepida sp.]|nr:CMD domain protein [Rubritepida sp.]